jgi:hypothetical protein
VPLPLTPPTAVAFVGVFPPFAFTDPNEDADPSPVVPPAPTETATVFPALTEIVCEVT